MQILRSTSRSISQDILYQKQLKKKYEQHTKMINDIHSQKIQILQQAKKINQVTQKIKKAKSTSKLFKQKQTQQAIKKQNAFLLEKLFYMQPTMKISKSENKLQPITASNWHSKKQNQQQIKEENARLRKRVKLLSSANQKQYRKKIQQDIKEYLSLKNNVRKLKTMSTREKLNKEQKEKAHKRQKAKNQTQRAQQIQNTNSVQNQKQKVQNQEQRGETNQQQKN